MKILDITEAKREKISILDKKTIAVLQKNCSEFLSNASEPMYRGFKRDLSGLSKIPIRTNRIPSDSDSVHTAAFNYIFEMYTGIPYIRNSTAFAAMSSSVARSYGEVGFIFPINGTKFYRADGINDVFSEFEDVPDFIDFAGQWMWGQSMSDKKEAAIVADFQKLDKWIYSKRGKVSKTEVNKTFGKYLKVWKLYLREFKHIMDAFYIYDGFHSEFNDADEEIAMFGASYYYALPIDNLNDKFKNFGYDNHYTLYMGKEIVDHTYDNIDQLIFNAIKNGTEIFAVLRKLSA